MSKQLSIMKPDDWHLHLREGAVLNKVLDFSSKVFSRALVMPNLSNPVISPLKAMEYKKEITKRLGRNSEFTPLMTLYLTESTKPQIIKELKRGHIITAIKYYPAGATTNSTNGIKSFKTILPVLEEMAKNDIPLCIHGELPGEEYDIFDREKLFIDLVLDRIISIIPDLRITLEHITTLDAIQYIKHANKNLAATITVHHLMLNRNHMFQKGIRPHYYCLPVAKREKHRKALLQTATSGNKKFFLGTDSAPHLSRDKESDCGCAGIFSAPYALNLLAGIFEEEKKLDNLEKFVSINGATHYNLPVNTNKITLVKRDSPIKVRNHIKVNNDKVMIFGKDFDIYWEIKLPKNESF